ncbi:hypothetical protein JCGZ_13909 [Jatropha curcas]|uniref:Stress-related protein n=1 Tax=Jatropha curcas TaxID=180498 RepID=A0A067JZA9_JATCU|nr:hypothetical protein JCGZ_13909 [Jatropha curcas]
MAEAEVKQQTETVQDNDTKLKYLDFIRVAAIYLIVCFSTIYEYAKENSGPLKPGVQAVEGTVKTVIGPVYDMFRDVPFELLRFVDHKVTNTLSELDRYVPSPVKQASSQARSMASEVQRAGVVDATRSIVKIMYSQYELTAKELYCKYEPVAEHYAVLAWRSLNRLPLFPQAAQIVVPTAAYWSEKYNQAVCHTANRGYTAATYLPLIPVDRITKLFDESVNGPNGSISGERITAQ